MGRYRLMKAMGGAMQVVGASERMDKVMRLAGLEKLGILQAQSAERKESTNEAK